MSAGESAKGGRSTEGEGPRPSDAANVLVLSGRLDSEARGSYLRDLVGPDLRSLLVVSFVDDPARWLDGWDQVGDPPATTVLVEETDRGGGTDDPDVERLLEEPADLTGLGITVSERLTDWGGESLLIFESLTVLLEYVELKRVFRFLHVLVNRVQATGATAHYHLDPTAHDDRTVATLTSLFDAVVAYEDGEWRQTDWP